MSEQSPLQKLRDRAETLKKLADELTKLKVSVEVDYTTEGLRKLASILGEARAHSERASEINAQAIRAVAQAHGWFNKIKNDYQDFYDNVVITESHKYLDRSWDERASIYRTKSMSKLGDLRLGEGIIALCDAYLQEIETYARSLYRARGDIEPIANLATIDYRMAGKAQSG